EGTGRQAGGGEAVAGALLEGRQAQREQRRPAGVRHPGADRAERVFDWHAQRRREVRVAVALGQEHEVAGAEVVMALEEVAVTPVQPEEYKGHAPGQDEPAATHRQDPLSRWNGKERLALRPAQFWLAPRAGSNCLRRRAPLLKITPD